MKKYEMTEKDLCDLWRLAKAGRNTSPDLITKKLKEIGFESIFVDNNFGGRWSLRNPLWMDRKRIVSDFGNILKRIGVINRIDKQTMIYVNKRFRELRL